MARVLADANVLFPFSLMDLMLALSQDRIRTLLWSEHLLEESLSRMAAEKRRPPMTTDDFLDALSRAGVPVFAARARRLLATA